MDNTMNKLKKIFLCILSLIILSTVCFAGCKDDDYGKPCENGKHTYGAYVYQNDATCTTDGTEVAHCTNTYCNAKKTRVSTAHPKTGHSITFVDEIPATCTENGMLAHYKCQNCGEIYSDENGTQIIENASSLQINKKGHTFPLDEAEWEIIIEAQKNEPGRKRKHCIIDGCDYFTDVPYSLEDDSQNRGPNV